MATPKKDDAIELLKKDHRETHLLTTCVSEGVELALADRGHDLRLEEDACPA